MEMKAFEVTQLYAKIHDFLSSTHSKIESLEYLQRSNSFEAAGIGATDQGNDRTLITISINHYTDRSAFGDKGWFYTKMRKRKVHDKETGEWTYVNEEVQRYEMTEGDMKFIYHSYVYAHLTQRQISKLSGIPEPYVTRYIKHKKLKPKYFNDVPKSMRTIPLDLDVLKNWLTPYMPGIYFAPPEIPQEYYKTPFHLDPFPTASEWKARREDYGLKNGENWRNTPEDENPGPRQYGDGHVAARKKLAKLARKEKRKKKAINKFNTHQNNRYGIDKDHPEGIYDPYKTRREELTRKKNRETKRAKELIQTEPITKEK